MLKEVCPLPLTDAELNTHLLSKGKFVHDEVTVPLNPVSPVITSVDLADWPAEMAAVFVVRDVEKSACTVTEIGTEVDGAYLPFP